MIENFYFPLTASCKVLPSISLWNMKSLRKLSTTFFFYSHSRRWNSHNKVIEEKHCETTKSKKEAKLNFPWLISTRKFTQLTAHEENVFFFHVENLNFVFFQNNFSATSFEIAFKIKKHTYTSCQNNHLSRHVKKEFIVYTPKYVPTLASPFMAQKEKKRKENPQNLLFCVTNVD